MKLLLYSHYFAPSIGGVETVVESLARGLAECRSVSDQREFDVTLVTQTPAGSFRDEDLPFPVIRQPGTLALLTLIRNADLVHVAGPALGPLVLAWLARKPVVIEHHGFQTICPNGQLFYEPSQSPCPGHFIAGRHLECLRCNASQGALHSFKLWLLTFARRFLARRAAVNIMPTEWLGELVKLPRSEAIPHGLDATRDALWPASKGSVPVVAFQGRLVTTKGIRLVLEAARRLASEPLDFELHVIGDGPERKSLERLADEWKLTPRVRFFGSLPPSELDAILARATVVVVPSLGGEVFGLVAAENMLRGLPVLASDLGAFAEVIGDAGLLFRTGDAEDLARRLATLLRDPALAADLGVRARQRVLAFFARSRMIDAHAAMYGRIGKRV
ncbi:MAG: hypothetical protein AUH88_04515 [Acidobacteria bacterium 13_1_40CM_4_61_5]|nr:MAG: hypothetical protein AUH88_04515 [Acidobacteria bacterium 13_1_40CM_4_61_5]